MTTNRRRFPRVRPHKLAAQITTALTASILDVDSLSIGGLHAQSDARWQAGEALDIELRPFGRAPIFLRGKVLPALRPGLSVQFEAPGPRTIERLSDLVRAYAGIPRSRLAEPSSSEGAPVLDEEARAVAGELRGVASNLADRDREIALLREEIDRLKMDGARRAAIAQELEHERKARESLELSLVNARVSFASDLASAQACLKDASDNVVAVLEAVLAEPVEAAKARAAAETLAGALARAADTLRRLR